MKPLGTVWDVTVVLTALGVGLVIPYQLGSGQEPGSPLHVLGMLIVTVVFAVDLVLRFRERRAQAAGEAKVVSSSSLSLSLDFVAALPYSVLMGLPLELLRLAKFARVLGIMSRWQRVSAINPGLLRLASFAFWIAVLSHWLTCGWMWLGGVQDATAPSHSQYIEALYWCITTLTTVGYGDITPKTDVQRLYTMFVMIVGVGSYGFIIGNVASLISNIDVSRARFLEKMEQIDAYLRYKSIPRELRTRVQRYYQYLWDSRLAQDDFDVVDDLIGSLRTEILVHISRPLVEKVPFFKNASDEFINSLVPHLAPKVFLPGDYIIRQGDVGDAMYFLTRGEVEVVLEDSGRQVAVLPEGAYFGEVAVLKQVPRTASVRAIEHCHVYELTRESVNQLMKDYPAFAEHVLEALDSYENSSD